MSILALHPMYKGVGRRDFRGRRLALQELAELPPLLKTERAHLLEDSCERL